MSNNNGRSFSLWGLFWSLLTTLFFVNIVAEGIESREGGKAERERSKAEHEANMEAIQLQVDRAQEQHEVSMRRANANLARVKELMEVDRGQPLNLDNVLNALNGKSTTSESPDSEA